MVLLENVKLKQLRSEPMPHSHNAVMVKTKGGKSNNGRTFHKTISSEMLLAQCFGLFPVQGITNPDVNYLKFSWRSWRIFYSMFRCVGAFVSTVYHTMNIFQTGLNVFTINPLLFQLTGFVSTVLFIDLARNWPKLMKEWVMVDVLMRSYGFPPTLDRRLKLMTLVIMSIALIEHTLIQVSDLILSFRYENNTADAIEHFHSKITFKAIFSIAKYEYWKGFLLQIINVLVTFSWTYLDLFIMLISTAIALRFKQITERFQAIADARVVNENVWKILREDYNRMCKLTRSVDETLSYIVLLSFASNLYFILNQLFNSLREMKNTLEKVYFFVSFAFLIMRTVCVCLYGAWINDESKLPVTILNSVPSYVYNLEIKRLIQQIGFDGVALTGRNFFRVTRGLILSIAGAIVTYELVLIQFNEHLLKEGDGTNSTK